MTIRFALTFLALPLVGLPAGAQNMTATQGPAAGQLGTPANPGGPSPVLSVPEMVPGNLPAGLGVLFTDGNTHTGGCAWVDYNGDYFPDLFITNGGGLDHFLFRNEGDGTFTDQSFLVPKGNIAHEDAGVTFADIDNDGDSDIFVAVDNPQTAVLTAYNPPAGGPNLLYVNQGDGTFVEDAAGWGLVDPRGKRNIFGLFTDLDNDGFVDAYLGAWAPNSGPYVHDNLMYMNSGTSFSTLVPSGGECNGLDSLVGLFWDANFDLIPDLYVGNVASFSAPPAIICEDTYHHGTSTPSLTDVTLAYSGIGDDACGNMGMDVGDIDNDGDWDLYITDIDKDFTGNVLYLGDPSGGLSENVAAQAGVSATYSWPANFADFNRDGWVDLWVGAMFTQDRSWLYINEQDGTFLTTHPEHWVNQDTQGGSVADFDADGDMDVFIQVYNGVSGLYITEAADNNNFMQFKLIGQTSNKDAIGAVVRVTTGNTTQMRRVSGGDSAHSQQELILHFGVAQNQKADVEVTWPSGTVQNFFDQPINQLLVIDESAGVLDQALTWSETTYDRGTRQLEVRAWTNYRGRTKLSAEGLGELRYNAAELAFEGTFDMTGRAVPESVRLTSERGKAWDLDVERIGVRSRFSGAFQR